MYHDRDVIQCTQPLFRATSTPCQLFSLKDLPWYWLACSRSVLLLFNLGFAFLDPCNSLSFTSRTMLHDKGAYDTWVYCLCSEETVKMLLGLISLLCSFRTPFFQDGASHIWAGSSPVSVKPFWKHYYGHILNCLSMLTLNSTKLIMKINHDTYCMPSRALLN